MSRKVKALSPTGKGVWKIARRWKCFKVNETLYIVVSATHDCSSFPSEWEQIKQLPKKPNKFYLLQVEGFFYEPCTWRRLKLLLHRSRRSSNMRFATCRREPHHHFWMIFSKFYPLTERVFSGKMAL